MKTYVQVQETGFYAPSSTKKKSAPAGMIISCAPEWRAFRNGEESKSPERPPSLIIFVSPDSGSTAARHHK